MPKAKKVAPAESGDAAQPSEKEELQKELDHWETYLKNQGVGQDQPHLHSDTVKNLQDRIDEL